MGRGGGSDRRDRKNCPGGRNRVRVYPRPKPPACLRRRFFRKGNFLAQKRSRTRCKTWIRRNLSGARSVLQRSGRAFSYSGKVSPETISSSFGYENSR